MGPSIPAATHALEEARQHNLTVDLTDGSGWPPGGSFLDQQDGFLALQSATQLIKGGQSTTLALPTIPSKTGVPPRLVSVLGDRVVATRAGETRIPFRWRTRLH